MYIMKNNKGQNTITEKVDTTIYALVEQNDGSLKKVNYEEYKQEKEKTIQLLIKRVDNVNKVLYNNPTMTMFKQHQLIKKLNKNLYYNNPKENTL